MRQLAEKVVRVCRELALCTEEPGKITRTFLSPPMRDVHRILGNWMRDLGVHVWVDAAGNLRGIYGSPSAPRLMIGSHLDTVPDAGAFDGVLGVVMGIALVETRPNMALEVVGFSEEEGIRFGFPFIGSRALVGTLNGTALSKCEQTIRDFGLNPDELDQVKIAPQAIAYLEFHIEQGPVLDEANLPLAVVDTIVGQSRFALTFQGQANHAGTTPMNMRHDALVAAAEWISFVETTAKSSPGLVATVGSLNVSPNAGNVIPGSARASLDVRHASDTVRHHAAQELLQAATDIGTKRGIEVGHELLLDQAAVAMDTGLCDILASGSSMQRMASGAGHDAMILAPHVPTAMLFLRSPGGISHHPDESVVIDDVASALDVGRHFIAELERKYA